jgi:hypothetical protein
MKGKKEERRIVIKEDDHVFQGERTELKRKKKYRKKES